MQIMACAKVVSRTVCTTCGQFAGLFVCCLDGASSVISRAKLLNMVTKGVSKLT